MLTPERIYPRKGLALLQAIEASVSPGGIWLPSELRYPSSAIVFRSTDPDIVPGSLAILQDDGHLVERSYSDAFKIRLRDFKEFVEVWASSESEPILREAINSYRSNPSTENKWITVRDLNTEEIIKFQCSDVEEFGFDDFAYPTYRLEYIPTTMLHLWSEKDGKVCLFYLIDQRNILATLEV